MRFKQHIDESFNRGDKVQVKTKGRADWQNAVIMFHKPEEDRYSVQYTDGDFEGLYNAEQSLKGVEIKKGHGNTKKRVKSTGSYKGHGQY